MARPTAPLTARQENFIRAEARGETHQWILENIFGMEPGADKAERHRLELQMSRIRQRPEFLTIWADELRAKVRRRVPGAISRIDTQVDDENGWLANKAANDYIALAKAMGVIANEEDKSITVRVEGMPDMGSPDQADDV